MNGFQELQIVAKAGIEREPGPDVPLILRVKTEIGIGLGYHRRPERLRETGVIVSAGLEVRERRKYVGAPNRPRIGDGRVVIEKISAGPEGVSAGLPRHVIDDLEGPVH